MGGPGYSFVRITAFSQAGYYFITGLWPLIHISSFIAVTGPKTDLWLVKTVGLLITVIAFTILIASLRSRITAEITALAVASALAMGFVDVYYALQDVIWDVYLLDAIPQLIFVIL